MASALLALASCAPQAFLVRPEMRGASKSGLNLGGKSMAVAYVTSGDKHNDAFNASAAAGFATRLEEDYFGGGQVIDIFRMQSAPGADYSAKDTLVNLVLDSGKDVVFLFDVPEVGSPAVGESNVVIPFTTKVYVYDSMNKDDKVLGFTGSKSMTYDFPKDRKSSRDQLVKESLEEIPRMADKAGRLAANTFLSTWKEDFFYVIYYEGAEKAWNEAANLAYSFKWDQAIEKWFTLLDNKNAEKKACAAYNIAVGCFLSGQPSLALEWLDRYEKDMPGGLDKDLRRKIKEYAGI